jgi:4a-hydroxytetrahydrobiopterin dehydratase
MATLLNDEQISEQLRALPDWTRDGDAIVRDLKRADFVEAIAFVERVAAAAERANHHPDILIHGYQRVRLTLSTHSAGGLTDSDFTLARELEALVDG